MNLRQWRSVNLIFSVAFLSTVYLGGCASGTQNGSDTDAEPVLDASTANNEEAESQPATSVAQNTKIPDLENSEGAPALFNQAPPQSDLCQNHEDHKRTAGAQAFVSRVTPSEGPLTGGTPITVSGRGIPPGSRLLIGGVECVDAKMDAPNTLSCETPPANQEANADVTVALPDQTCISMAEGFRYVSTVSVMPRARSTIEGQTVQLSATGGKPPYTFLVLSGDGSVDQAKGIYTAPGQPGTAVIQVKDSLGSTSESVISVSPPLAIQLGPTEGKEQEYTLTVVGGAPPLTYAIKNSDESQDSNGNAVGKAIVTVTDATGTEREVALNIHRMVPLTIFASNPKMIVGKKTKIVAAGGKPPYKFSITGGSGVLDESTGDLTAPGDEGSSTLIVTDAAGATAQTSVSYVKPVVVSVKTPIEALQESIKMVGAGFGHSCVVNQGNLRCWGDNRYGEVGDGTLERRTRPTLVEPLGTSVLQVVTGYSHTCALVKGGRVECWGDNRYGQLGIGPSQNSLQPQEVDLSLTADSLAAGQYHTCAVLHDGSVYCWGSNRRGQLGTGDLEPSNIPLKVLGLTQPAKYVSLGAAHSCALLLDGSVQCWGFNGSGQLGDGTLRDRLKPVAVLGLQGKMNQLSAGGFHSCSANASEVYCWGHNNYGQLGQENLNNAQLARQVKGLPHSIQAISAGFYHTCAAVGSGQVQCWGNNQSGQLGDGSIASRQTLPVVVKGVETTISGIAAGVDHTCALVDTGVQCWGANDLGQFGSRSLEGSRVPVRPVALTHAPIKTITQ